MLPPAVACGARFSAGLAAVVAATSGEARAARRWRTRVAPSPAGNSLRYSSYSLRAWVGSPLRSRARPTSSCASREYLLGGNSRIWLSDVMASSFFPAISAARDFAISAAPWRSRSVSGAAATAAAAAAAADSAGGTAALAAAAAVLAAAVAAALVVALAAPTAAAAAAAFVVAAVAFAAAAAAVAVTAADVAAASPMDELPG